ncbi:MAG: rhomboid family intramembrane serine protease, partial [Deltaproteobacteria bacterium]|nr:rhomboid family intramembrane serine protease [Deltaproteobacteria bacterium]
EENAPPAAPEPLPAAGPGPQRVALAVATALGVLHAVTGPARSGNTWFAAGAADATQIQAGELWRVVTALCLHVDLVHVAGNAVLGGVLLVGLGRSVGPGLACALVLAAGAGGNLVNALLRGTAHVSVGASTAVFASVGLLGGIGAARLRRRGLRWGRALLPVAAALGVLAMLGSGGGRVDIFAHMFGLLVGTVLGGGVGALVPQAPRTGTQRLWGAAALAAVLGCWLLALGAAS